MNTKTATVYTDFLRFMLASLTTGMVAALLLSLAVILLSPPKAISTGNVSNATGDGAKHLRTTRTGLPGAAVA